MNKSPRPRGPCKGSCLGVITSASASTFTLFLGFRQTDLLGGLGCEEEPEAGGRVHKKRLEEMEPISGPLITVKSESVGHSVCPTLQPAGLSVPGILWARLLQWAIPFSGGFSQPTFKPKFLEHYCSQTLAVVNRLRL